MSGKVYSGIKAKVNLVEKELLYMADDGMELVARTPIKKIKFYSHLENGKVFGETTLQGWGVAVNTPESKIYQVLVDSSAKLLKEVSVTYTDSKKYGEATITRAFSRREVLYGLIPQYNPDLIKVEKTKTALSSQFGERSEMIRKYIDEKKLNCKNERDLIEIFSYYSGL
jgi:hypothetical protein